ncbi:MAG: 16S rRNA (cytosine(967)-C(5))-methyltransferase RsmB [Gammaproteobacteria bacterium]|nr:16S rRNA (cytosine(967)-C(5))-methyltransferase RsmB [Gammaproteobacteria bacterium]MDP2348886.1 16S rRNA (cytosine(967)-C(5))-methyltransferase RsmB [Gammaproteobacteria bacterium]
MKQPSNVRAQAALVLSSVIAQEGSLATLLNRPTGPNANVQDYALLQEICFGTCRWYFQLDAILRQLITKPLKDKDADLRCLLLIGIYQLHYLRVPEYAVVNETVAATLAIGKGWAKGLVNGVLRSFLRESEALIQKANAAQESRYVHPLWFIKQMKAAWPEHWESALAANNLRPPMTLRVNASKITREKYLGLLADSHIGGRAGPLASSAIYLDAPRSVDSIPGFREGLVSVQDEASQMIPELLELEPGLSVLDACAAPGGKTCHILESVSSLLRVLAIDNDSRRLEKLRENLQRLNLAAYIAVADAGDIDNWWDGEPFDRILLDAPCSATGIIRRHPDIKLLRRADDVVKLSQIQLTLLANLWKTLKPDGLLLYSTCSVLPAENSEIVAAFLANSPDAKHEVIQAQWGVECGLGRQLLPQPDGNDGFYYALLRKRRTSST